MDFKNNMIINIYSILILAIIWYHSLKHNGQASLSSKLFMLMVQVAILMLVFDIFSRMDGKPDTVYALFNQVSNFLIFMLSPILPSIWLLFAYDHIYHEEKKKRWMFYPLLIVNSIHMTLLIFSQHFGWFYYIDSNNVYHRGPLILLSAFFIIAMFVASFILITINRKRIEKRYYLSFLGFAVLPFGCIILQIMVYGLSLVLNGIAISLLLVFLNIQNKNMHTDYLTGVNNRKKLELYLKKKVNTSTVTKTFSAILIDVNEFKLINDTFGHDTGDEALRICAKLLKSCLRSNDFIARFGGDEFCIILESFDTIRLEKIVQRINNSVEEYNRSNTSPYKLGFSMGYAIYDYCSHMNAEEFKEQIDQLMYENKRRYKQTLSDAG